MPETLHVAINVEQRKYILCLCDRDYVKGLSFCVITY